MPRDFFSMTVGRRTLIGAQAVFEPLSNIEVTVWKAGAPKDATNPANLATIFQTSGGSTQGPRAAAGATGTNPFTTGVSGLAEFFCDQGRYEITWKDLNVVARLAANLTDPVHFNSSPSGDGELLTKVLAGISKTDLLAVVQTMLWETGSLKDVAYPVVAGSEPSGWLLCDGRTVSRTAYAALFATIGTTYGAGDGSTTFNLPDLQGRARVGRGTHADVNALAKSEGATVANRKPRHSHTVNSHSHQHIAPQAIITGNNYLRNAADGNLDWNGSSYDYLDSPGQSGNGLGASGGNIGERWVVTSTQASPGTNEFILPFLTVNVLIKT